MTKIFIDGSSGTTGLRIHERIAGRKDIEMISLAEEVRKDPEARKDAILNADVAFLCLPDAAAIEAVSLVEGIESDTVIIDTSTAHRTNDDWAYGFPEIAGLREKIMNSKRIANPGCHASGFISLAAPLVAEGVIAPETVLSCFSLTGYSGGGKKMIAQYEDSEERSAGAGVDLLKGPRMYGLTQVHKHLPEMAKISALKSMPVFCPIVGDFYSGMEVVISLNAGEINGDIDKIKDIYRGYYTSGLVKYNDSADEGGFMSAAAYSGRDDMEISVSGNDERILLVSRFDNLGKGASGAAIQNMNIVLGIPECTGLVV